MNNRRPIFYILAGIYLLYIDYSFIKDWESLENKTLFLIFMILFGIIGGGLIIYSAWKLLKDRYGTDKDLNLTQTMDDLSEERIDEEASDQDVIK